MGFDSTTTLILVVALGVGLVVRQLNALRDDIAAHTPDLRAELAKRRKTAAVGHRPLPALALVIGLAIFIAWLIQQQQHAAPHRIFPTSSTARISLT